MKKTAFLICSIWASITLLAAFNRDRSKQIADIPVFEYISYEYGPPLLKSDTDFSIRRSYQVYENRELVVTDRLATKYRITRLTLDKKLYRMLTGLENLGSMRVKQGLDKGVHYGGAYDYVSIRTGKRDDRLCFIVPLVSGKLQQILARLYQLDLSKGAVSEVAAIPDQVQGFRNAIIPVHEKAGLPKIVLPPSILLNK